MTISPLTQPMTQLILRVREQRIGEQSVMTLWLLQKDGATTSGLMHGDIRPDTAERVIGLLESAGVKIQRDPPYQWHEDSEPTVEERIAETEKQGVMF